MLNSVKLPIKRLLLANSDLQLVSLTTKIRLCTSTYVEYVVLPLVLSHRNKLYV